MVMSASFLCLVAFLFCAFSANAQTTDTTHYRKSYFFYKKNRSLLTKQGAYTQPYWGYQHPYRLVVSAINSKAYQIREAPKDASQGLWLPQNKNFSYAYELYEHIPATDSLIKAADFVDKGGTHLPYSASWESDAWLHPEGIYKTVVSKGKIHDLYYRFYLNYLHDTDEIGKEKAYCEIVLSKQDFRGNVLWDTPIGKVSTNPNYIREKDIVVRCNGKGDAFVLTSVNRKNNEKLLYLSKIDGKSGKKLLSNRKIPSNNGAFVALIPREADGCYLVLLNNKNNGFVLQSYDNRGVLVWKKEPFVNPVSKRIIPQDIKFFLDTNANLWLLQKTDAQFLEDGADTTACAPLEIAILNSKGEIITRHRHGKFLNYKPYWLLSDARDGNNYSREFDFQYLADDPIDQKVFLQIDVYHPRIDFIEKTPEFPDADFMLETGVFTKGLELVFDLNGELLDVYYINIFE